MYHNLNHQKKDRDKGKREKEEKDITFFGRRMVNETYILVESQIAFFRQRRSWQPQTRAGRSRNTSAALQLLVLPLNCGSRERLLVQAKTLIRCSALTSMNLAFQVRSF